MSELIRVETPRFVAGLVLDDGICTEAAPILKWARGKRWAELRMTFIQRHWLWDHLT